MISRLSQHVLFAQQSVSCRSPQALFARLVSQKWPDVASVIASRHSKHAMKPGYTSLLIKDVVLPGFAYSGSGTACDLARVVHMRGRERTKSEWIEIVDRADDFRVDSI